MIQIQDSLCEIEVNYRSSTPQKGLYRIVNSATAYKYLEIVWSDKRGYREEFYALFLNRGNGVLGHSLISTGTTSGCLVDVKTITQIALKTNCSAVILAHNHPSGNLSPSHADKKLTEKLKTALGYFDIQVLDHLILDDMDSFLSLADDGYL